MILILDFRIDYYFRSCYLFTLIRGHSTTMWTEFCHFLTPLRGQFLYPERGQKQTFFDPPPHLVHVVIECHLSIIYKINDLF